MVETLYPTFDQALSMDLSYEFLRCLLKKGVRADLRRRSGYLGKGDPAILAYLQNLSRRGFMNPDHHHEVEILKMLIANGADINAHATKASGYHSPLTYAICECRCDPSRLKDSNHQKIMQQLNLSGFQRC